jgi:hypothetical protein
LKSLVDAGLPAIESIGYSDFKVDIALLNPKNRSEAILGILLDGNSWNLRKTAIDRDVLPSNLLLSKMGWPSITRVWTPDWLSRESAEIERITSEYQLAIDLLSKPKEQVGNQQFKASSILTSQTTKHQINPMKRLLDEVPVWKPLVTNSKLDKSLLDQLHRIDVGKAIAIIVDKLTHTEGPVSPDRLVRYLAGVFNLGRVSQQRATDINNLPFSGHSRDKEDFLYPRGVEPGKLELWRRSEQPGLRALADISVSELSCAVVALVQANESIKEAELLKQVAEVFGFKKLSEQIETRAKLGIKAALDIGAVRSQSGYIIAM